MAARTPFLAYQNLTLLAQSSYLASSNDAAFPPVYIRDPMLTKPWRSLLGWNVVTGFNNAFDFQDAGNAKTASLAAGNYATGAAMATQLQTAMNATAGILNTYTVTYNASTGIFTFARATGTSTFGIELSTPSSNAFAIDAGFNIGVDKTGSTTYNGDNPSYHTREWLRVDLGAAYAVQALCVNGHAPLATGGVITIAGNSSDSWTAPASGPWTLAGDNRMQANFLASTQTFRYWRVLVNDVQNPLGYSQLGVVFAGGYVAPARSISANYKRILEDLSLVDRGDHGSFFQDKRATGEHFQVKFPRLNNNDFAAMEAIYAYLGLGRPFFFALDPLNQPSGSTYYGVFTKPFESDQAVGDGNPPERYTISVDFLEVVQ